MRLSVILINILLITLVCNGQGILKPDSLKLYTVKELKDDFVFFRAALETAHPSLYRVRPKDSINYYLDNAYSKIDRPMQPVEFWEIIQNVICKIGSGHTNTELGQAFYTNYNKGLHYHLPFDIMVFNNRLYVNFLYNRADTSYKVGDEIVAINNKPAGEILNRVRNLISGDGYSNTYKDFQLNMGSFTRLYGLLNADEYQFLVTFKSGQTLKRKLLKAVNFNYKNNVSNGSLGTPARSAGKSGLEKFILSDKKKATYLHQVNYLQDIPSTAVVKLNEFSYGDYEVFHKELFDALKQKNINNLVLDLRNNPGGAESICIDLLSYLVDKRYYLIKKREGVTDVSNFKKMLNTAYTKDPPVIDFSSVSYFHYQSFDELNMPRSFGHAAFRGNIYLLVNGGTFSAASLFTAALKEQGSCTVIGEETGGGMAGCDGGYFADLIFPNTAIKMRLPLLWSFTPNSNKVYARGVLPDIPFPAASPGVYSRLLQKNDNLTAFLKDVINRNK